MLRNLALFCALMLLILSCSNTSNYDTSNTLARVDNQYLSISDVRRDIPEYVLDQDSIYALQQYQERWVREQLLLKEANRLGLAEKQHVQQKLEKARQEILIQALKDHIIGSNQDETEISDEEARAFYQANKKQFTLDEKFVKFRHMRTRSHAEAQSAKQDLLNGVTWKQVAQKYSVDPQTALRDSDQFWPLSMALKDISSMNRYLNVIGHYEISPIQRVNGDYHFVQLTEMRAEGEQPDLNWLIEQIKDWMILNKNRRNFNSFVQNLYLEAQSNNELEVFNVTSTQSNLKSFSDTLEHNSTDE